MASEPSTPNELAPRAVEGELIASPGEWQPGDWVLDAAGAVWVRSKDPRWVWGYASENAWTRHPHPGSPRVVEIPSGSVEEYDAVRPLTLLIRDGRAAHKRE